MTDAIEQFLQHMKDVGCAPSDPACVEADDKFHRYHVEGDKPGIKNGSYKLSVAPDGFGFGFCMTFKEGVSHGWHTKSSRKFTAEEKADHKKRTDQVRRQRESERVAAEAIAADRSARMWKRASKVGSTAYSERKGILLHGARVWRDLIIVPVRRGPDLVSLQFISPDGSKRFLRDGPIEGAYFSLATSKDDLGHIGIVEGYATGCTVRQATGLPVICAFNAGNLKAVAVAIRKRYPDATITLFADHDQWTERPDGTPWNPGLEKAQEAAVAIGGARVLAPVVDHDDPERPTDWNDVGEDAVREAFFAPIPDHRSDEIPDDMLPEYDDPIGVGYEDEDPLSKINPQGHNDGQYYFYPVESGQITALTAPGLNSMQNLYRLAPRKFWEDAYGDGGKLPDKQICSMASAHLMDACHRRGIYLPETTRGVGVWIDDGEVVVNTGDAIYHRGQKHHPAVFKGQFVYESGPRVMTMNDVPLRNADADKVRQICRMLTWKKPLFADLLAGWMVIAPVGGALGFRSHIWLTGGSGTGKTTIVSKIIAPVIGQMAIMREGGTTEAAVRKALGKSSRPYFLDEAESEGMRAKANMQQILTLARIAASGGTIQNANETFRVQSCFGFSSIVPAIEQLADENRITLLSVERNPRPTRGEEYAKLLQTINETFTPDYCARLMARTVQNMDALLQNTATFTLAAQMKFGNARSGEHIGPMLAGAFLLTSTRLLSLDEARSWIDAQEWSWHEGNDDGQSDSHRCLSHMLAARIRYDVQGMSKESPVGELVDVAAKGDADDAARAHKALRSYGFFVEDGRLYVANTSPPIKRIMADTPWTVWKSSLERYPGADNAGGKTRYFAPGLKVRAVSLPLSDLLAPVQGGSWDDVQPEVVV